MPSAGVWHAVETVRFHDRLLTVETLAASVKATGRDRPLVVTSSLGVG